MMNFKNLTENLIIVIVAAVIGGVVGYFSASAAYNNAYKATEPVILAAIEKTTTEVKQEISNSFRKVKIAENGGFELVTTPELNSEIQVPETDTTTVDDTQKRRWWQRKNRRK